MRAALIPLLSLTWPSTETGAPEHHSNVALDTPYDSGNSKYRSRRIVKYMLKWYGALWRTGSTPVQRSFLDEHGVGYPESDRPPPWSKLTSAAAVMIPGLRSNQLSQISSIGSIDPWLSPGSPGTSWGWGAKWEEIESTRYKSRKWENRHQFFFPCSIRLPKFVIFLFFFSFFKQILDFRFDLTWSNPGSC